MSDFYSTISERFKDWNYNHPRIIHGFILALKPDVYVDCGTYRAFSACWAAKALQENNKGICVCIDNWSLQEHVGRYGDPRKHAESNMEACGVREWIEIHQGDSTDPKTWPDKVDMCYIDGFHSYNVAWSDARMAIERGATFLAFDDTENCVGPRIAVDEMRSKMSKEWDVMDIHSDNGLTIFLKKAPRRLITFSQELPYPNPGVDLRPLSKALQKAHFDEAQAITGIDYTPILNQIEHDTIL